jgi:dGTPase
LIDLQVTDLIKETEKKIVKFKVQSSADVKKTGEKIATFSKEIVELRRPLREFLVNKMYNHYRVMRMSNKAKRFIKELFNLYINSPEQLPPHIKARIGPDGTRRAVSDYIAGMTDRYALDEYKKLFDPYEKV